MSLYAPNPKRATIRRMSDHYYILTLSDGRELGGPRVEGLKRYARSLGETPTLEDLRSRPLRVTHGY